MTGRTIPVTRTDGSEVAGEATQELIKAKTDNLDIALSALRDALRGSGSKTNTDIVTELASIGGASAAAAGDTGASTTNGFLRWMRDFWLSLKGTKTAANSLSVTGASDGVFYVGGVSADGVAPTNQAVRVSGVDGGGLKRTLLTDNTGIQYFRTPDGYSASNASALAALNDTFPAGGAGLAVPGWARSCTFYIYGTFSQTATLQISFDNAATWIAPGYLKNLSTGGYLPNVATANQPIVFDIPPGVTHIQVKCTTYGSGTAGVLLAYSAAQVTAFTTAALTQSTSRAGCVFAPGIWYDDTSAALTANSTFTSTARDVTATSSGSAFSSASTNAKEFRVMAEQDVAFTLQIQASRDNSTFRVIQSITATNISGGGYVAEAVVSPKWRYYRYAIVNGGSNAARTTGGSILMAN